MTNTWKYMQSRKKLVADKFASQIYTLWLEEAINAGDLPLPTGSPSFYEGQNKDAYSKCSWIGASRGQIDELKETQAAVLRMNAGLATLEGEAGKLGYDWRELLKQKAREQKLAEQLKVTLDLSTEKPSSTAAGLEKSNATAAADPNATGGADPGAGENIEDDASET